MILSQFCVVLINMGFVGAIIATATVALLLQLATAVWESATVYPVLWQLTSGSMGGVTGYLVLRQLTSRRIGRCHGLSCAVATEQREHRAVLLAILCCGD